MGLYLQVICSKSFPYSKKIVRVMTFNKITDHSNPIFAKLEFLKIDDIW